MSMPTTNIEFETVYDIYDNWYMIKYYRGKLKTDRYLVFSADEDKRIVTAIYGKMDEFGLDKLKVKGALITEDICNLGDKSEIKTYTVPKRSYLVPCLGDKGKSLKEEARSLMGEPESYYNDNKIK